MRIVRRLILAGWFLALVGCEQESQSLPFEVETETTRSGSPERGAISSPGGAAVGFPAGAVAGRLLGTLAAVATPAAVEGAVASSACSLEPATTVLHQAAQLEVRLWPGLPAGSAWLASLVGISGGIVRE